MVDRVWFEFKGCFFPQQGPESEPAFPCKCGKYLQPPLPLVPLLGGAAAEPHLAG